MDENDHLDDDEPLAYRTGQIRIVGAEPVGAATPEPAAPGADEAPGTATDATPPVAPDPWGADSGPVADPELPHWTDAPTGQVPKVLARDDDAPAADDPWSAMPGPTWREEGSDWAVHEESFEPSMLADDRLGAMDDSDEQERQPWAFDLAATPPAEADVDPLTEGAEYSDEDTVVAPPVRVIPEPEVEAPPHEPYTGPGSGFRAGVPRVVVPELDDDLPPVAAGAVAGAAAGTFYEAEDDDYEEPRSRLGRLGARRGRRGATAEAAVGETAAPARPPVAPTPPPPAPRRPPLRPPTVPAAGAPAATADNSRNMPVAIGIGVALFVLVLILFDLGTVFAMLISTVVVFLGAAEAYAAFRRGGYHPATLLGLAATLSLMVATYNKGLTALPLVIVLLVAFSFIWYLAGVERTDPVAGTGATLLVFCWVSVFGSFAGLLLNPNLFPNRHGIAFLLGAVITSVACDVGALAVGRSMGRHPLAASISPNKTWEGAIGGGLFAIAVAVIIVHFIHPWNLADAAWLGIVVAIVSPLGDLCESMVKRTLGLKDMGRILPGHGGILDRVDGLLFVLPATYFLVKALHLG